MNDLRPFFKLYGGKWRIAPTYPPPEHPRIVEPFAGGAGYSLRYADRRVLLVERDDTIAALWAYLIRVAPSEVLALPLLGSDQTVADLGSVAEEARSLVGFWLNAGTSGPCRRPSAWMRSGIRPGCFWGEAVRARLARQVESIRHWRVMHASYEAAGDIGATWFVDPPYEHAGKHYRGGRPDFAALGAWTKARRGLVVACENEGATWLPFRPHIIAKANEGKHGGKTSREAVYVQRSGTPVPRAQTELEFEVRP